MIATPKSHAMRSIKQEEGEKIVVMIYIIPLEEVKN